MSSICVYLGANQGNDPIFTAAVKLTGQEIAKRGLPLVYGGSSLGLMGTLANTVKEHGGRVIGIITSQLIDKEKPLTTLDELHIVASMQERKQLMQQKSAMFLVMPGGLGTMEEAFDTWNAIRIGLFTKPIGFLNIAGYFDGLFSFMRTCEDRGFISTTQRAIPIVNANASQLLAAMQGETRNEMLSV
ncbi:MULTISPECIES: TIGR00730 family Rossman fold protein [unclassified Legionella]|uniref:LOG family protein n=1 Tax=unclassified Legionella TaxID=2622702 RepID=UPI00105509FF|nr:MULTISPECIES: TIGR00730 family Rossman fold protein [unclassified Legionella]MDI9818716.1 TIGR00730 family Rossman fold protein [Legionella sp. PL877]